MRDIYKKAEKTAVWLGNEDADSEIMKYMYKKLKEVAL